VKKEEAFLAENFLEKKNISRTREKKKGKKLR